MQKTTNYGLNKPEGADFFNVEDFNENFESLDTKVKELEDTAKDTASKLSSHTANKSNPHGVTKGQVGLGNVPNVATNDQTPTYTDITTLSTLTSGEKLSTAFSKIKLAITNLISHLSNKNNPHGVTAYQIGAVKQGGGAGQGTNTVAIGWAGNTGGLKATVDATDLGTLVTTGNADGVVLPIYKGGTGASSASDALAKLGAVQASELNGYNFTNMSINSLNVDAVFNYNYVVAISEAGHGTVPVSASGWISVVNFYTNHFVTQLAFTCGSGTNADRPVRMWIRERYLAESSVWSSWRLMYNTSLITASTTDLTAGTSILETGKIYLVYE